VEWISPDFSWISWDFLDFLDFLRQPSLHWFDLQALPHAAIYQLARKIVGKIS
jgi:hypothetical protein